LTYCFIPIVKSLVPTNTAPVIGIIGKAKTGRIAFMPTAVVQVAIIGCLLDVSKGGLSEVVKVGRVAIHLSSEVAGFPGEGNNSTAKVEDLTRVHGIFDQIGLAL
jgi:hypothetical protein